MHFRSLVVERIVKTERVGSRAHALGGSIVVAYAARVRRIKFIIHLTRARTRARARAKRG